MGIVKSGRVAKTTSIFASLIERVARLSNSGDLEGRLANIADVVCRPVDAFLKGCMGVQAVVKRFLTSAKR